MIYSLTGILQAKKDNFIVLETSGGVGYKIFLPVSSSKILPQLGERVNLVSYLHVKEDALQLYGFATEEELNFFEQLISVQGVGPKTALGIFNVAPVPQLVAAIVEGKPELLTRASGIGKKTAERLVLELKGKLASLQTASATKTMEQNLDLEDLLVGLGYNRGVIKEVVKKLDPSIISVEGRLRAALRLLKK